MKTLKQTKTGKPLTIHQIIKDLLSPADHFARLLDNAQGMEESAWQEIGSWYEPEPVEIGCGFADPVEVRRMVGEICKAYGMEAATESLLVYLYLKHRQLFLTHFLDFYRYEGGYHFSPPWDDAPYEVFSAYGYPACTGPAGDIVDFEEVDRNRIPFGVYFPTDAFWRLVSLDYELPLGMLSYGKVLEPIESCLCTLMHGRTRGISPLPVLENLAFWAQQIENEPRDRFPYIALVTHARLLQGLRER